MPRWLENEGIMDHLKGKAISFGGLALGGNVGIAGMMRLGRLKTITWRLMENHLNFLEEIHLQMVGFSSVMLIFKGVNATHFGKIKLVYANVAGDFP